MLNRDQAITALKTTDRWDLIIIGGGATGLGTALDAAARGYKTLLLEALDFASGTSSRSTKLVHGGVRYLEQGNIQLVYSALRERGILLKNAPHLVKKQSFIIPCYTRTERLKFGIGLKLYDWLSGKWSFGRSVLLSRQDVIRRLPGIKEEGLKGGVEYFDGQFDDARLAITLAATASGKGAVLLNYMAVTGIQKKDGHISGVEATDRETNITYTLNAKAVINATGVFTDDIIRMDQPGRPAMVRASQGVHIVLDRSFMDSDSALLIPKTPDGRVLFAVPWQQHIIVGTTDTPVPGPSAEPVAHNEEIDFILDTISRYLVHPPRRADILSVFAGLRPLVIGEKKIKSTKELSRDHTIRISPSGLITITGGKWTTYRKMAEDTVNAAAKVAGLPAVNCLTKDLKLMVEELPGTGNLYIQTPAGTGNRLCPSFPYTEEQVIYVIKNEMARTIDDVLARRLRILFLNAREAKAAAQKVAVMLDQQLGKGAEWKEEQLKQFRSLADHYLVSSETAGFPNRD